MLLTSNLKVGLLDETDSRLDPRRTLCNFAVMLAGVLSSEGTEAQFP